MSPGQAWLTPDSEWHALVPPASVRELTRRGHVVTVERGAGGGVGVSDDLYLKAGARIASTADEIFAAADMIVKVKEPQAAERQKLREGQVLFTYCTWPPIRIRPATSSHLGRHA